MVADLVATIAKRFSYSVSRGISRLKYGRENWGLNVGALLNRNREDPFILWLEAMPKWDGVLRIDKYLIEFFSTDDNDLTKMGFSILVARSDSTALTNQDLNLMKCQCSMVHRV